MDDGTQKMQVDSLSEVEQIGYVEDLVNNIPTHAKVIIEKDHEHGFVATIIDQHGYEIKQVIDEAEALQLGYVENVTNLPKDKQFAIEKDAEGNYFLNLLDKDGSKVQQIITEEEALKLGYEEMKSSSELRSQIEKNVSFETLKKLDVLPNTATDHYNALFIGVILFVLGLILFFRFQRNH